MGYVLVMGPCWVCGRVFSFNADRVPSTPDAQGRRQPVCGDCMRRVNEARQARGLAPHAIDPQAYEPQEEGEL